MEILAQSGDNMIMALVLSAIVVIGAIVFVILKTPRPTRFKKKTPEQTTDLKYKLDKSRQGWMSRLTQLLSSGNQIDDALYEQIEETLITADMGLATAEMLLQRVREKLNRKDLHDALAIREQLQEEILSILESSQNGHHEDFLRDKPFVLMIVGVNGVGKTTTIGKLAMQFGREGRKVLLAAGDTFRAAAVEQLEIWGERAGVEVIRHPGGKDPAAVVFDATQAAVSRQVDILIVDTAGRLHTKVNLMEELKKMSRIMKKNIPDAPHAVWLVLDATTGQNALQQAKTFHEELGGLTGIILTKLDGTGKGGILVSLSQELKIPIQYIGVGEGIDDLRVFQPQKYVDALFSES